MNLTIDCRDDVPGTRARNNSFFGVNVVKRIHLSLDLLQAREQIGGQRRTDLVVNQSQLKHVDNVGLILRPKRAKLEIEKRRKRGDPESVSYANALVQARCRMQRGRTYLFGRPEEMHPRSSIRFFGVQEHCERSKVFSSKSDRRENARDRIETRTINQQINVASSSNGAWVARRHPCSNRIPADNCVRDSRFVQRRRHLAQPLFHPLNRHDVPVERGLNHHT